MLIDRCPKPLMYSFIISKFTSGAAGDTTETKDSLLDIWRPVRTLLEMSKSVKNCLLLAYLGRGISTNLQSEVKALCK